MEGTEEKMEVTIDTNKILASIISSGKVRKIVVFSPINFFILKRIQGSKMLTGAQSTQLMNIIHI